MKKVLKLDKAIMGTIHVASIVVKTAVVACFLVFFFLSNFKYYVFFLKVVKTMILNGGSYIVKGFVLFTANVVECE